MARTQPKSRRTDTSAPEPNPDAAEFVRFETMTGDGLFQIAGIVDDLVYDRIIRVTRKQKRELFDLLYQIRHLVPVVPAISYRDSLSRRPITWFRTSAKEQLKLAEELVQRLNRLGANIRRIATSKPPAILYEDEYQIVTRRPRQQSASDLPVIVKRHLDRRKRQARRKENAERRKARSLKSSF